MFKPVKDVLEVDVESADSDFIPVVLDILLIPDISAGVKAVTIFAPVGLVWGIYAMRGMYDQSVINMIIMGWTGSKIHQRYSVLL